MRIASHDTPESVFNLSCSPRFGARTRHAARGAARESDRADAEVLEATGRHRARRWRVYCRDGQIAYVQRTARARMEPNVEGPPRDALQHRVASKQFTSQPAVAGRRGKLSLDDQLQVAAGR